MQRWANMTRNQIKKAVDNDSLVLVMIGATEQHGPHLTVDVDNQIIESIASTSVKKAEKHIPIILGPHISFGYSPHHLQYAGAISLSVQTMLSLINDVIESILASGFKKVFLINSHGGNGDLIRIAIKKLHEKHRKSSLGTASYWELAYEKLNEFKLKKDLYDVGHAGQFESSLMLAINEQSVRMDLLSLANKNRNKQPLLFAPYVQLNSKNIWAEMDGFSDLPSLASKEIGEQLINLITDDVSLALQKFYHL